MRIIHCNLLKSYLLRTCVLVPVYFPNSYGCVKDPLSATRQPLQNSPSDTCWNAKCSIERFDVVATISSSGRVRSIRLISILISGPTICPILSIGASRPDARYPKQIWLIPVYRERTKAQAIWRNTERVISLSRQNASIPEAALVGNAIKP